MDSLKHQLAALGVFRPKIAALKTYVLPAASATAAAAAFVPTPADSLENKDGEDIGNEENTEGLDRDEDMNIIDEADGI
jgi:hypothetical protein